MLRKIISSSLLSLTVALACSCTYAAQSTIAPPNMKDYQPAPPLSPSEFNSRVQTLGKQNQATLNQSVVQTLSSPPLIAPPSSAAAPTTPKAPPPVVEPTPAPTDNSDATAETPEQPYISPKKPDKNASEQATDNQNVTGFGSTPNSSGKKPSSSGFDVKY
jgi:hypothetical protein